MTQALETNPKNPKPYTPKPTPTPKTGAPEVHQRDARTVARGLCCEVLGLAGEEVKDVQELEKRLEARAD